MDEFHNPRGTITLPMNRGVIYIVEERMQDNPSEVAHAWNFNDQSVALEHLVLCVRAWGHERLYTAFTHIQ